MKKLTSLVLAGIFTIFCLTGCAEAEESKKKTSETTTTVTTVTTTTTVPESVPESTTTKESERKTTTTTTKVTTTTTKPSNSNRVVLDVKNIQMLPELPSGSEITSLAIVLNYYGFNINKMDLLKYLKIVETPDINGIWVDPREAFVGNPTKSGYGCYSDALKECVDNYFTTNNVNNYKSNNRNCEIKAYIREINSGNPVIVWVTKGLVDVQVGERWYLEDGGLYSAIKDLQCMVIIGYDLDKNTFIVCDPFDSRENVEYPIDRIDTINELLNGESLVIQKK